MAGLFITGTGTGVGKTIVTAGVVRILRAAGVDAVPMKPFQTGCAIEDGARVAPDLAYALRVSGCVPDPVERPWLCPYAFEPACSPHLAARLAGVEPRLDTVVQAAQALLAKHDAVVAEGAGGLLVPVNARETMADLAVRLGWPVLVVARSGLGTINETLLTLNMLRERGLVCVGVVLNDTTSCADDFIRRDNPDAISRFGKTHILARLPWLGAEPERDNAAWERFAAAFQPPVPDWAVWRGAASADSRESAAELRAADMAHVWHPYTQAARLERQEFPIIARAEGVWLEDVRGHRLLDGISSWWCANLGHSHPRIVSAIRNQASCLQHSILGGMSHPQVIRLAAELSALAPAGLTRAYFCSDGACSTEAAMRMAIEYWHHRGQPGKNRLVSLAGGYHGDTLGAVGAGYIESFHAPLRRVVNPGLQAESPHCFACPHHSACNLQCFDSMERLLTDRAGEVAAVIVEPLCQGAAGMRIYPAAYLQRLRELCDRQGVLWIADEIAVGFGRTGRLFACEHAGVAPDLICLGKGLTGGTLPMSAVLCRQEIFDAFRSDGRTDPTFYHGHTFAGNPIAAAAARAALDLYRDEALLAHTRLIARQLAEGFERLAALPAVARVKTLGLMSSLQVRGGAQQARAVADRAVRNGLLIRPLGDILYLWPPLVTSADELDQMLDRFANALDQPETEGPRVV